MYGHISIIILHHLAREAYSEALGRPSPPEPRGTEDKEKGNENDGKNNEKGEQERLSTSQGRCHP